MTKPTVDRFAAVSKKEDHILQKIGETLVWAWACQGSFRKLFGNNAGEV